MFKKGKRASSKHEETEPVAAVHERGDHEEVGETHRQAGPSVRAYPRRVAEVILRADGTMSVRSAGEQAEHTVTPWLRLAADELERNGIDLAAATCILPDGRKARMHVDPSVGLVCEWL
jgi:hypothetical protein